MVNRPKKKLPNCWICNDHGLIFYTKKYYNIQYDFAYRCKCKLGQQSSERIRLVPDEMIDKLAEENFEEFRSVYPELVMKFA